MLPFTQGRAWASRLAIALFLICDFTVLALNYWLSQHIEEQAVAINLAGRQRMLTQRISKVLLQLERKVDDPGAMPDLPVTIDELIAELRDAFGLFDDTLNGFATGHRTRDGDNEGIWLMPVTTSEARTHVDAAVGLWNPYRQLLQNLVAEGVEKVAETVKPAAHYAVAHNLELLARMNQLTSALEEQTRQEAASIRRYQGLAFLAALLNFGILIHLQNRRVRESERHRGLLDEILNKASTCILLLTEDGNTIVKANQSAEELFGYRPGELNCKQLAELIISHEGKPLGLRKDGTNFPARCERSETHLENHRLFIETVSDITQQRMTEEHLSGLAYHDVLTRLPNRLLFDDRLRMEIAHARERDLKLGVLFIDLDNFKPVNDQHGHDIGDQLLQAAATRLKMSLRESDTISRRGGDEFTAILSDIANREDCARVAQIIISQLERPFQIENREMRIGASIGIALFPDDGSEAQLLINRADEAMYQAKQQGRGIYRMFGER